MSKIFAQLEGQGEELHISKTVIMVDWKEKEEGDNKNQDILSLM